MSKSQPTMPGPPPVAGSLDNEELLTRVSARLLATWPEGIESIVVAVLEDVRVFFGADRCGLLSVGPDGRVVRVRHASYREGVNRVSADIDLADLFPWSHRMLLDEKVPVCIGRLDDLPPEAAVDRATYAGASVRSTLTVPIPVGQRVEHLITVQTFHREVAWPAAHVARLRLLGELLVNALERARSYLAITESERRSRNSANAGSTTRRGSRPGTARDGRLASWASSATSRNSERRNSRCARPLEGPVSAPTKALPTARATRRRTCSTM
jgi:GAF domain-containing protein